MAEIGASENIRLPIKSYSHEKASTVAVKMAHSVLTFHFRVAQPYIDAISRMKPLYKGKLYLQQQTIAVVKLQVIGGTGIETITAIESRIDMADDTDSYAYVIGLVQLEIVCSCHSF